jgi:hypothetical protein
VVARNDFPEFKTLFYENSGILYWKVNKGTVGIPGKRAGSLRKDGRLQTGVDKKYYLNHRIIFFLHYNYLPKYIDHIDGNPLNNNIANLREASKQQNQWNRKKSSNNTSGTKNVYWHTQSQKWRVVLTKNKKDIYMGSFNELELAELVAIEADLSYHGEYSRYGS